MRVHRFAIVAALVIASACADSNGPPQPATLHVVITHTGVDVGALLVSIAGPQPPTLAPAGSGTVLMTRSIPGGVQAAVFGTLSSGNVLEVTIPDGRQKARYTVMAIEAAGSDNSELAPATYTVTLR